MILRKCPAVRWLLVIGLCFFWSIGAAQSPDQANDTARDSLVFKDGDRVHGRLIERTGDTIVFKSDRFGELRVPAKDVVVIRADQPTEPATKTVVAQGIHRVEPAPGPTVAEQEEQEKVSIWNRFSPAVLTAKVREFFGPWHGRVALSNDVIVDTSHRNSFALDTKLARKFEKDAVELTARYDYDQTNNATTTDVMKGTGSWRHDFNRMQFTQYRPTLEWNRAGTRKNAGTEYVLLQQEIGLGVNLLSKPARKVRLGISENLFDIWTYSPGTDHSSRAVESLFDEMELTLPWRMALTQRGVWYPVPHQVDGWENRVELNKKLTETLSVAIRHEMRRDNPDGTSQDYTRLKLLLGFDF